MKKLISLIGLALVVSASAADFKSQNFISSSYTNLVLAASVTTNLPASVRRESALWQNPDGSTANANVAVSIVGTNANATNIVTFTFHPIVMFGGGVGTNAVTTETGNKFEFTLTANGTTPAVLKTNLPTAIINGCKGLRLVTVATSASSNGGGSLTVAATMNGFVP